VVASNGTSGTSGTSRRAVLRASASAAAVVTAVAACERRDPRPNQQLTEPVDLGPAEDVPVGGARLYRDEKVLVCQPQAGEYRAFSAVCPHAGCVLSALRGEEAICSCHGSAFDPATGAVLQGPAEEPLRALELELDSADGGMTARPPAD
jgi:Rieske Fe-S protein